MMKEESISSPPSTAGSANNSFATSPSQKRVFKIIVVGDSCVGKTCLTYRFCEGKFPGRTEATIGVDFREKVVEVDGESIKVKLTFYFTNTSIKVADNFVIILASDVGHCWAGTF